MSIIYKNRNGGDTICGIPAQMVGEELERIRKENGGELKPADVIAAAKPKSSPFHDAFTWENEEAAIGYRLWQARQLIKSVSFVVQKGNERIHLPVFVNIPATEQTGQYYQATHVAVTREDEWRAALMALRGYAEGILRTTKNLGALAKVLNRDTKQLDKANAHFTRGANVIAGMIPAAEARPTA